jgi:hypothetical protein
MIDPTRIYISAYAELSTKEEYRHEIGWIENIKPLEEQTWQTFEYEYIWVVLNAGMKEQIARKIYERFLDAAEHYEERKEDPFQTIGHKGKRKAISSFVGNGERYFQRLQIAEDKIEYLKALPWIGDITKYHLAKNMGIDCVKPDRHLERMAKVYDYATPYDMCKQIQIDLGGIGTPYQTKLATIDLVLWRWCNLGRWKP